MSNSPMTAAHRQIPRGPHAAALLVCALLSACASAPPNQAPADGLRDEPSSQAVVSQAPAHAFEQRQRERAASLARQGRLADAAVAWELLTVLRPESAEYRERLAEARSLAEAAAAERMQRAAAAYKRGELDNATLHYLSVLAVQPEHAQAAEALRSVERDRNKRYYLGKLSRITLTRRATQESEVAAAPRRLQAAAADRNDLEHATMLATQGELDTAIQLLERHLAGDRRDDGARLLLAEVYFQKAEKLAARDKASAIAALERCVRLDAGHARATALLKELRGGNGGGAAAAAKPSGASAAPRPATPDPR
jgi:tetratricopeptide (TPR) repeat protein